MLTFWGLKDTVPPMPSKMTPTKPTNKSDNDSHSDTKKVSISTHDAAKTAQAPTASGSTKVGGVGPTASSILKPRPASASPRTQATLREARKQENLHYDQYFREASAERQSSAARKDTVQTVVQRAETQWKEILLYRDQQKKKRENEKNKTAAFTAAARDETNNLEVSQGARVGHSDSEPYAEYDWRAHHGGLRTFPAAQAAQEVSPLFRNNFCYAQDEAEALAARKEFTAAAAKLREERNGKNGDSLKKKGYDIITGSSRTRGEGASLHEDRSYPGGGALLPATARRRRPLSAKVGEDNSRGGMGGGGISGGKISLHNTHIYRPRYNTTLDSYDVPVYSGFSVDHKFHPALDDALRHHRERQQAAKQQRPQLRKEEHDIVVKQYLEIQADPRRGESCSTMDREDTTDNEGTGREGTPRSKAYTTVTSNAASPAVQHPEANEVPSSSSYVNNSAPNQKVKDRPATAGNITNNNNTKSDSTHSAPHCYHPDLPYSPFVEMRHRAQLIVKYATSRIPQPPPPPPSGTAVPSSSSLLQSSAQGRRQSLSQQISDRSRPYQRNSIVPHQEDNEEGHLDHHQHQGMGTNASRSPRRREQQSPVQSSSIRARSTSPTQSFGAPPSPSQLAATNKFQQQQHATHNSPSQTFITDGGETVYYPPQDSKDDEKKNTESREGKDTEEQQDDPFSIKVTPAVGSNDVKETNDAGGSQPKGFSAGDVRRVFHVALGPSSLQLATGGGGDGNGFSVPSDRVAGTSTFLAGASSSTSTGTTTAAAAGQQRRRPQSARPRTRADMTVAEALAGRWSEQGSRTPLVRPV